MTQSSYKILLQLSSAVFRLVSISQYRLGLKIQYLIDYLSDSELQKQVRRLSLKK